MAYLIARRFGLRKCEPFLTAAGEALPTWEHVATGMRVWRHPITGYWHCAEIGRAGTWITPDEGFSSSLRAAARSCDRRARATRR